jgi:predicted metal-dependent peptidase
VKEVTTEKKTNNQSTNLEGKTAEKMILEAVTVDTSGQKEVVTVETTD